MWLHFSCFMTIKLLSIDVWNTLLLRNVHEVFPKYYSSRILSLRLKSYTKEEIFFKREAAERNFTGSSKEDHSLDQIFECLLQTLNVPRSKREDLKQLLISNEINYEIEHCNINQELVAYLNQPNFKEVRKIFISDFYMSTKQLQEIIRRSGLHGLHGYVSCDTPFSKRSGHLYTYVKEKENTNYNEWMHIGDNLHSDVEIPSKLGIKSIYYLSSKSNIRDIYMDDILSLTFRKLKEIKGDNESFNLGLKTSVLWAYFLLVIAEMCIKDSRTDLFFLTREGEFFEKCWSILFPKKKLSGLILPTTHILEVSRLSTYGLSLKEVDRTEEYDYFFQIYNEQTVETFLESLGLCKASVNSICREVNSDPGYMIKNHKDDCVLKKILLSKSFKDKLSTVQRKQSLLFYQYLKDHGWFVSDKSRYAIVDIGWRGSIQDNISRLCPKVSVLGFYFGLKNLFSYSNNKVGIVVDENNRDNSLHIEDVSVFEMLCSSPNGSVRNYYLDNGRVYANREENPEERKSFETFAKQYQDGVLAGLGIWAEVINSYSITSDEIKLFAHDSFTHLQQVKSKELLKAYNEFFYDEKFGLGKYINRKAGCYRPTCRDIFLGIFFKKNRIRVINFIRFHKIEATIHSRNDMKWLEKSAWICIIKCAKFFHRFKKTNSI